MGENQCAHCGHIVTGFEQQEFEHKQACDAVKGATIARLEAENARLVTAVSRGVDAIEIVRNEALKLKAENEHLLGLFGGLTLRDWFAGMALAEVPDPLTDADAPTTARLAYAIADAMIAYRASNAALAAAQPAGEAPPDEGVV